MNEVTKIKRNRGVGRVARNALRAGMTNAEALEHVRETFPGARTTLACIQWYRHDLRSKGEKVLSARGVRAVRDAAVAATLKLDQDAA